MVFKSGQKLLFKDIGDGKMMIETDSEINELKRFWLSTPALRQVDLDMQSKNLKDGRIQYIYKKPPDDAVVNVEFYTDYKQIRIPFSVANLSPTENPEIVIEGDPGSTMKLLNKFALDKKSRIRTILLKGSKLYTAGDDKLITVWSPDMGKKVKEIKAQVGKVYSLQGQGKSIYASGLNDNIVLLDTETGEVIKQFEGHEKGTWSIDLHKDRLLSGSLDKSLILWDSATGKKLKTLTGHSSSIRAVAMSSKYIISGGSDKKLMVWNPETGEQIHALTGHMFAIRTLDLHPEADVAISGADDLSIRFWELKEGKEIAKLNAHTSLITVVKFIDANKFISAGMDGSIKLWDFKEKKLIAELKSNKAPIMALDLNIETGKIYAATSTGEILVVSLPQPE